MVAAGVAPKLNVLLAAVAAPPKEKLAAVVVAVAAPAIAAGLVEDAPKLKVAAPAVDDAGVLDWAPKENIPPLVGFEASAAGFEESVEAPAPKVNVAEGAAAGFAAESKVNVLPVEASEAVFVAELPNVNVDVPAGLGASVEVLDAGLTAAPNMKELPDGVAPNLSPEAGDFTVLPNVKAGAAGLSWAGAGFLTVETDDSTEDPNEKEGCEPVATVVVAAEEELEDVTPPVKVNVGVDVAAVVVEVVDPSTAFAMSGLGAAPKEKLAVGVAFVVAAVVVMMVAAEVDLVPKENEGAEDTTVVVLGVEAFEAPNGTTASVVVDEASSFFFSSGAFVGEVIEAR